MDSRRLDRGLKSCLGLAGTPPCPPRLAQALRHAVVPGGARFRPMLCLTVAGACGDAHPALAEAAAVALELLHCASLVSDDLPCFDDAAVRRGSPSVHVAFGQELAILAGNALIVQAFDALARVANSPTQLLPGLIRVIARGVGSPSGIAAGQAWESETPTDLGTYHRAKTGALFESAIIAGALAGGGDPLQWTGLGHPLGEASQVVDDLRDAHGRPELLASPPARTPPTAAPPPSASSASPATSPATPPSATKSSTASPPAPAATSSSPSSAAGKSTSCPAPARPRLLDPRRQAVVRGRHAGAEPGVELAREADGGGERLALGVGASEAAEVAGVELARDEDDAFGLLAGGGAVVAVEGVAVVADLAGERADLAVAAGGEGAVGVAGGGRVAVVAGLAGGRVGAAVAALGGSAVGVAGRRVAAVVAHLLGLEDAVAAGGGGAGVGALVVGDVVAVVAGLAGLDDPVAAVGGGAGVGAGVVVVVVAVVALLVAGADDADAAARELAGGEAVWRFYFSANFVRSAEVQAFVNSITRAMHVVQPGAEVTFTLDAKPGETYRLLSLDTHSQVFFPPAADGAGVSELEVTALPNGLQPGEVPIARGPVSVRVVNRGDVPVGFMAVKVDWERLNAILAVSPSVMRPFLTAKCCSTTRPSATCSACRPSTRTCACGCAR